MTPNETMMSEMVEDHIEMLCECHEVLTAITNYKHNAILDENVRQLVLDLEAALDFHTIH